MRLSLIAVLACAAGCGGGELTAAGYPAAYAKALSAQVTLCRHAAASVAREDEDSVRADFEPDLVKAIKAGRASFDPKAAQACLDGLNAPRDCRRPTSRPVACFNAVIGLETKGASCSWLYECVRDFCDSSAGCPGTCPVTLGAGAPCGGQGAGECDGRQGLLCIENLCSQLLPAFAHCPGTSFCDVGLYCDDSSSKCMPERSELGACASDEQCQQGLFCAAGFCRKKVARGLPCGEDSSLAPSASSECQDAFLCAGFSRSPLRPGTCASPGEVGAACVSEAEIPGCAEGLDCAANLCTLPPVSGPCFRGTCLRGTAFCDDAGQCETRRAAGSACTDYGQCLDGACTAGSCAPDTALKACHEP